MNNRYLKEVKKLFFEIGGNAKYRRYDLRRQWLRYSGVH